MVIPKHQKFSLQERIRWQRKIIRHDKWVLHTRGSHHRSVVEFARHQLQWTTQELKESLLEQSSSGRYLLSSSAICWACWDRVAYCESTGNWSSNTGNGFEGGLQFTNSTWIAWGGGKYANHAYNASREQQIIIANGHDLGNWPVCRTRW
jgi:hypothetical protein